MSNRIPINPPQGAGPDSFSVVVLTEVEEDSLVDVVSGVELVDVVSGVELIEVVSGIELVDVVSGAELVEDVEESKPFNHPVNSFKSGIKHTASITFLPHEVLPTRRFFIRICPNDVVRGKLSKVHVFWVYVS